MSRSLKTLRERDLIDNFGTKTHYFASEKGLDWCKLNVDGFKEKEEARELKEKKEKNSVKQIFYKS